MALTQAVLTSQLSDEIILGITALLQAFTARELRLVRKNSDRRQSRDEASDGNGSAP